MKQRFHFTMIELLVVVGIIALLAGLITPAAIYAQRQGRITQAQSDMRSILMALANVEGAYGRMVKVGSSKVDFNGKKVAVSTKSFGSKAYNYTMLGGDDEEGDDTSKSAQAYDAMIAELSDPGNSGLTSLNVNKRKKVFLDPKPSYDPSAAYTAADNANLLWRDPWGNRYRVYINTDGNIGIPNPAVSSKLIAVKAAVVSLGPNGTWDDAKNINYPDEGSPSGDADDIASWRN